MYLGPLSYCAVIHQPSQSVLIQPIIPLLVQATLRKLTLTLQPRFYPAKF